MPPGSSPSPAAPAPLNGDLPAVLTHLSPIEAVTALDSASRRGKLAGFHKGSPRDPSALFHITDFGAPFESVLEARSTPGHDAGGCELRFSLRIKPFMPTVMVVILILTVWPGVWLADSMLRAYFTSYAYSTWIWYVPLTVLSIPFIVLPTFRRSHASARAAALEHIVAIREIVGQPASKPATP